MIARHRPVTTLEFDDGGTVTIALRQVTNPVRVTLIRDSLGLSDSQVILEGRLVTPKQRPAALKAGSKALLTWAGVAGVARYEPYQGASIDSVVANYGERIVLTWTTDAVP